MQVFPPWASSVSLGLHPLVSDTHRQCIRQTPASRVQTLCMHTDEPINRPFIPMTYYTLTSDRMWADCSNNISFRPSSRNVYTSTSHARLERKEKTHPAILAMYSAKHKYIHWFPPCLRWIWCTYLLCANILEGEKNIAFGSFVTQFLISVKADHWHTLAKCNSNHI